MILTISTVLWPNNIALHLQIYIFKIKESYSGLSITSQVFERILLKFEFIPMCHVG